MFKWFALVGASLALVMTAAACGGGDDEKTIDLGDGNEVSVGGDLPDEWPDDFPVYDGADLQGTTRTSQEGISGISATWTTGDSAEDVAAFYSEEFADGEWKETLSGEAGGASYWSVENSDGTKAGYVSVTGAGGDDTIITAIVGDNPDGGSGDGSDDGSPDDGSSDDGSSDDGSSDSGSGDADLPDEVDLPEDFPTDVVSIPNGYRVTTAQSYSSNGQTTFIVGFITKDSAEDAGDAFESELTGKGFTQSLKTSDGTGSYAAYSENDDGTGTIIAISINESSSYDGYQEGVVQVTEGA